MIFTIANSLIIEMFVNVMLRKSCGAQNNNDRLRSQLILKILLSQARFAVAAYISILIYSNTEYFKIKTYRTSHTLHVALIKILVVFFGLETFVLTCKQSRWYFLYFHFFFLLKNNYIPQSNVHLLENISKCPIIHSTFTLVLNTNHFGK